MNKIFLLFIILLTGCSTNQQHLKKPQIGSNAPIRNIQGYMNVSDSSTFVNYINAIRARGATCSAPSAPLANNSFLQSAAQNHSKDMAFSNQLQHDGSGSNIDVAKRLPGLGSSFFERILFFGYTAKANDLVGENITHVKFSSVGSRDKMKSFKKAIQIFLADPPHCKILMESRFRDVGVGYYKTKDGYYWTVDFGETE